MSGAAAVARRKLVTWMGGAAVVAVLLGATAYVPAAEERKREEVGRKVLPAFAGQADKAALVMVTTGEESYHLVKNGTEWVMPEKGNYPVEAESVAKLTRALAAVAYARPMTRDEKKFDRIGLGDPAKGGTGALVEVGDGHGETFAKLIVGYRDGRSYVREVSDLQAWAVEGGEMPPLQRGSAWLNLDVVSVPAEQIAEVSMRPRDTTWYTLVAADATGRGFVLAQPHAKKRFVTAYAPVMVAQALTRFSPVDVQPAGKVAVGAPVGQVIVAMRSGVSLVAMMWRKGETGWVTLGAAVGERAGTDASTQAQAINARVSGWAFAVSELDWGTLTTPLSALAE